MEADRVNREEDVIDIPVGVQQLFDERKRNTINRNVRHEEPKLFRMAVLCGAIIVMFAYFMMPVSRVHGISVTGNANLSRSYILNLAGVSEDSIYYLSLPVILERKLEHDPLIEKADVSLERDNTISITVDEADVLGYRYDEEPVLLLTDGNSVPLKSEYLDIISRIPLVIGFNTEEQTAKLCKSFAGVEQSVIRDISEISQYSLSYDPQAIRVLMRSGGYFMGNYYNITVLNRYWDIYNHQNDKTQCIFADDSLTSAYSKMCPWDEPVVNKEYWKDEKGNIITNTYGDQVEKHYYLDAYGNYATDGAGNKIPIPISLQGFEVPDDLFLKHYEKGFYKTGKLVLPEGYDENAPDETEAPEESAEATEEPSEENAEAAETSSEEGSEASDEETNTEEETQPSEENPETGEDEG